MGLTQGFDVLGELGAKVLFLSFLEARFLGGGAVVVENSLDSGDADVRVGLGEVLLAEDSPGGVERGLGLGYLLLVAGCSGGWKALLAACWASKASPSSFRAWACCLVSLLGVCRRCSAVA